MIYAFILAGGSGLRLGGDVPKQFLSVDGKPVLIRTIEAFLKSDTIDHCFVSCGADWLDYTSELLNSYGLGDVVTVAGGKNRNTSLLNALEHANSLCPFAREDIALTHDAVRMFITPQIIDENISLVKKFGACTTAVPTTDTILVSRDGEFLDSVPERKNLYNTQTPQSFYAAQLLEIFRSLNESELDYFTDACSVYLSRNKKVALARGLNENIKITYPRDLTLAECILKGDDK